MSEGRAREELWRMLLGDGYTLETLTNQGGNMQKVGKHGDLIAWDADNPKYMEEPCVCISGTGSVMDGLSLNVYARGGLIVGVVVTRGSAVVGTVGLTPSMRRAERTRNDG